MLTLAEAIEHTGFDVLEHLDRDADIPVIDGYQAQGDLLIAPIAELDGQVHVPDTAAWIDVPAAGVEVLRGTAMGNPHTLIADPGVCRWTTDVVDATDLALGVLTTTQPAYLAHSEHGYAGIAPGTYVIRRQREQADEVRMVAD